MFTKGQKIAHAISYEMRETNSLFSSLRHAAEEVKMTGGNFTAKDVSSLLEIASNYLISFDQVEEFNSMVETAQKRAYEMYEKKIEDLEDRIEELENEKEELEENTLSEDLHPLIKEALYDMIPNDRITYDQAEAVAASIRNCGRFDASQLKMAI